MKTPMSSDTKLTKDEECESVDSTKYRGMIANGDNLGQASRDEEETCENTTKEAHVLLDAEAKAVHIILDDISNDIYFIVDAFPNAKEM
ncbi:hypothetical protein Tco_1130705 [Tanacetum coccineum]